MLCHSWLRSGLLSAQSAPFEQRSLVLARFARLQRATAGVMLARFWEGRNDDKKKKKKIGA